MSEERPPLRIWTIYKNPSDYPDKWVARLFENDQPTETVIAIDNYDDLALQMMTQQLHRMPRSENDEPQIVEMWL